MAAAASRAVQSGSRVLLQHEGSGSLLCADGFFEAQPWLTPFDGAPPQGCVFELSVPAGTEVLPRELAVLRHLSSGTVLHTLSDSTSDGAGVSLRSDERLLPTRHWQLLRSQPAEAGSQCLQVGDCSLYPYLCEKCILRKPLLEYVAIGHPRPSAPRTSKG